MMAENDQQLKRKVSSGGSISPPLLRRKVQSTTTQTAVASFFTPASQKPPEKTLWTERAPHDDIPSTLLVGKYVKGDPLQPLTLVQEDIPKVKIAAFDFDSTLIQTLSGKKFASDAQDWKWWHPSVPGALKKLHDEEGYRIVIISNQGAIALRPDGKAPKSNQSRSAAFKSKVMAVFNQLDRPISIYAATEKDIYRKPRTGIWKEMLEDFNLTQGDIDFKDSIFVGDAGGRLGGPGIAKDFSCSDRDFAGNVGITFYTPEEYFLQEPAREFRRTFDPSGYLGDSAVDQKPPQFSKRNDQDLVIFCGSPGAGKSTFYWKHLEPLEYMRVNQDLLKTREKCIKVAEGYLKEGKSVVIDSTNADPEARSKWIEIASKFNIPIRCVLFLVNSNLCEHNDAVRALNKDMNPEKRTLLPKIAFTSFGSRYRPPNLSEGFQDIIEVKFQARVLSYGQVDEIANSQLRSFKEPILSRGSGLDIGLESVVVPNQSDKRPKSIVGAIRMCVARYARNAVHEHSFAEWWG